VSGGSSRRTRRIETHSVALSLSKGRRTGHMCKHCSEYLPFDCGTDKHRPPLRAAIK